MPQGTLLIGIEEGKGLEDRGFVTKQNPVCEVIVGKSAFKTDAAAHGGGNPLWEERFVAYLDDGAPSEAEVIVWSAHHIAESDEVGRGTVSLATVYEHAYQESQVSIVTQEGKHVGEVDVFFVYASKEEKTIPKTGQGKLTLRVIRALDLQETGILKYQDPFVVIETAKTRLETAVAKGAGSDPEWKAAFELDVSPEVQAISFTIYNKNTLTDNTVIGTASYPLAQSISTGFEESRVPVTTPEGNVQGSLHIRAAFHPSYTV